MKTEWQHAVVEERAEDSARGVVAWMVADVVPADYQEQRPMKSLHRSRPDTLWANAAGLAGAVGWLEWQRLVLKNPMVLMAPGIAETLEVLRAAFSEEDVRGMVAQSPAVLMAKATTVESALAALMDFCGGDDDAAW